MEICSGELHQEVFTLWGRMYCTALGLWQRELGFPLCFRESENIFRGQVSLSSSFPRGSHGAQRVLIGFVQLEMFLFFYTDTRDWQELMMMGALCRFTVSCCCFLAALIVQAMCSAAQHSPAHCSSEEQRGKELWWEKGALRSVHWGVED